MNAAVAPSVVALYPIGPSQASGKTHGLVMLHPLYLTFVSLLYFPQHTNDFALYTEAIKFFNNPESMVRIAVRTLTLNVYKGTVSPKTYHQALCRHDVVNCPLKKTPGHCFTKLSYHVQVHQHPIATSVKCNTLISMSFRCTCTYASFMKCCPIW